MNLVKKLSVLFTVLILTVSLNAQGTASTGTKGSKSTTGSKAATAAKSAKPGSGEKVDTGKKGPHGETMYIGPKNGSYYYDKNGNKVYPKKK